MDSSAGRDRAVRRNGNEAGTLGSQDVPGGVSIRGRVSPDDRRSATAISLPENGSGASRREERLTSDSAAWKLGHDLIERHEYGRAVECFRRVLLSADRLSAEAAETALQLCAALSHERAVARGLQDARGALDRDLSRLGREEVSLARGSLAAYKKNRFSDTHEALFAASGEATRATAHADSTPTEAAMTRAVDRPRLRVHFFGCFELLLDGEAMSLGRNARALSILKYLLAHRDGRPVSQDYLMGWLWPESDPKRARWSLNSAVHALRKTLVGCLPSLPAPEAILFEAGGYRLSPRVLLSADTGEFDSRYEKGLRLEEVSRAAEAAVEYEKAAELYRGDYLIEDLYEEWTMIERERLADAYADLSRRLVASYVECGRLREGIRTCYRVLEKDRCDEDAHRLLIECFLRLGQRGRALRQYRLCEQALRHEYDMMPSPRTRSLHASILKESGSRQERVAE